MVHKRKLLLRLKLKKGTLGGKGFFKKSLVMRRRILVKKAKNQGEKRIMGKLQAIVVLNKRKNPLLSRKAARDRRFIAASFIGRRKVKRGKGLSR